MKKYFIGLLITLSLTSEAQIQNPEAFLGYPLGSRFTYHHQIVNYCKYLANASKDHSVWYSYGKTPENRELGQLIITSPGLISNLSTIKRQHQDAILGKITSEEAIATLPTIINLSFNVHGNEAAGSEAAMGLLYDLFTKDSLLTKMAANKPFVILIDPCINPDGREAYTTQFNRRNLVLGGNPDPNDQEHFEGQVSGRYNHFLFDLNRDWVWQTQPETKARLAFFQSWLPMVHADFHEQSYQHSYYFPPAAKPYLNFISNSTKELQESVGKSFAQLFDKNRWPYFTSEVYDLFYPGYGDTYPILNGALGMTLEQGGIRGGLRAIKSNEDTISLYQRVTHHRSLAFDLVSWSLLNSTALKRSFYLNHANYRTNPTNQFKTYVIPKSQQAKSAKLIQILRQNRITISLAAKDQVVSNAFRYKDGKYATVQIKKEDLLISAFQSSAPMIQALLDPTPALEDSLTYDITAWNLFQIHGIESYGLATRIESMNEISPIHVVNTQVANAIAYAFTPATQDISFLNTLHQAGFELTYNDALVAQGEQTFPSGSYFIHNPRLKDWSVVLNLANLNQIKLAAITSFRMDKGPDVGSPHFKEFHLIKPAVVVDVNFDTNQQGELGYYLTQQMGIMPSMIPMNQIFRTDLSQYSHIIFPNGKYNTLSSSNQTLLTNWIRKGGTCILFEGSSAMLVDKDQMLEKKSSVDTMQTKVYATTERTNLSKTLTGNLVEVAIENTHPIAFRLAQESMLIINQADELIKLSKSWNPILKTNANPNVFGFLGAKRKIQIGSSLFLGSQSEGKGNYIWFGFNPLFRAIPNQGLTVFENTLLYTSY